MTSRSEGLADLDSCGYLEMHAEDASQLGLCEGDRIEVESRHGQVETVLRVPETRSLRRGVVYMPFHFADSPANRLTGGELDPSSKIPGLKVTAVSIRPSA
jgi:predicted molibdopterin-dependent oxidoreductase YjgC